MKCLQCEYEISSFTEALEALEGGCRCLLCGSQLAREELVAAVDRWKDEELLRVGEQRAQTESEFAEEEELHEGVPDFGDEGEDEEDPLF
ncbi:MAG: hypothetical protein H8E31_07800 [Planctomycetes bacterium]|nr:hypothetical protein [Planctomycetota bacterium]